MKQSISAHSILAGLTSESVDALKTATWCCGLLLSELDREGQSALLERLLVLAVAAEPETRSWVLAELVHYVENMSPTVQANFTAAYTMYVNHGSCDCSIASPSKINERISRRLEGQPGSLPNSHLDLREAKQSSNGAHGPAIFSSNEPTGRRTVALVVPEFLSANSFLQPPLEMLLAAARLRDNGYSVTLVDNRVEALTLEALAKRMAGANIIVVTTTPYDHIQNYFLDYRLKYALRTITFLKQRCPEATVITCGAHGTVRPDIVFNESQTDVVLKGELDTRLLSLVEAIDAGAALQQLTEVCVRGGAREKRVDDFGGVSPYKLVQLGPQFQSKQTVDDWTLPAYDLIDLDNYYGDVYVNNTLKPQKRCATMLATRGCAYDCSFCFNFWGRRVRYRSPESAVEEMEYLEKKEQAAHVFFLDFHFSQDASWVSRFCALVRQRGLRLGWSAQVRCDAVPLSLLEEMAAAHCGHLWFGVESFDEQVIAMSNKYPGPEPAITAIANCRKAGIEPHLFVMIGLPGETRKSINITIAGMHAAKASYCGVMVATPRFGTQYYQLAKEQFPHLGNDFYSLRSVRGLTANDLEPADLQEALSIFERRDFMFGAQPPQLSLTRRVS